ncbi:hypothetical protein Bhyg_03650 [Pseudolycoriella hygida]|uniref:F-box domain-containing protein n=1 Tax=Pseudolycoriella hygida TaxID=35572 RepID=A0A9Q0NDR5_9DIPT|nr:hypothetical protein Bhyg_03650 [Pseudolycoriella hygida]
MADARDGIMSPLENELVVNNVFEYLRLADIIQLRRVSKLWHNVGTKYLMKRIDEIRIFDSQLEYQSYPLTLSNLQNAMFKFSYEQDDMSIKFTNFTTYWFEGRSAKLPNQTQTRLLFGQRGRQMKRLTFIAHASKWWEYLSDVLSKTAPNLEELNLECYPCPCCDVPDVEQRLFRGKKLKLKTIQLRSLGVVGYPMFSQQLLSNLFQCCPELQTLHLEFKPRFPFVDKNNHEPVILTALANQGNLPNLKCLTIASAPEDVWDILNTRFDKAPIETFKITTLVIRPDSVSRGIQKFLTAHTNTLKTFYLCYMLITCGVKKVSFPKMEKLKHLTLHENSSFAFPETDYVIPFESLDVGKLFPNLVTLNLYEMRKRRPHKYFNACEWFPENTTPLLTLRNLTLPSQSSATGLRHLQRIFPNILTLKLIVVRATVLRELWVAWPNLKELDLRIVPFKPDMRFLYVPTNAEVRKKWCVAVGRPPESLKPRTPAYCCIEHFNRMAYN